MKLSLKVLGFILLVVLSIGCGESPTDPTKALVITPSPVPTLPPQTVTRLAMSARQGGNIVREVDYDTFFVVEAGFICSDPEQDCPRPRTIKWNAAGAYCEFFTDTNAPQVVAVCIGGGIARFIAYSPEYNVTGELQIRVIVP